MENRNIKKENLARDIQLIESIERSEEIDDLLTNKKSPSHPLAMSG